MSKKQKFILIVDNEDKVIRKFRDNHGDDYRIESITYKNFIPNELKTKYFSDNKPDLILTDNMHEINDASLNDLKGRLWNNIEHLNNLIGEINELSPLIYDNFGINLLEAVRDVYGDNIPVGICSGFGAFNEYMNSELHEKLLDLRGEWVPLRLGKPFESKKMEQLLRMSGKSIDENRQPCILSIFRKTEDDRFKGFIERHKSNYQFKEIDIINSIEEVDINSIKEELKTKYHGSNEPNIILISLRFKKADASDENRDKAYAKGNEVMELIDNHNKICEPAYGRHGIQVLNTVKEAYGNEIPAVGIYTGFGTIFEYKNNELFERLVELNGTVFQKGLSKSFESKMIKRLLERK